MEENVIAFRPGQTVAINPSQRPGVNMYTAASPDLEAGYTVPVMYRDDTRMNMVIGPNSNSARIDGSGNIIIGPVDPIVSIHATNDLIFTKYTPTGAIEERRLHISDTERSFLREILFRLFDQRTIEEGSGIPRGVPFNQTMNENSLTRTLENEILDISRRNARANYEINTEAMRNFYSGTFVFDEDEFDRLVTPHDVPSNRQGGTILQNNQINENEEESEEDTYF